MSETTVTVYIGEGSRLFGGPFSGEEIIDHDSEHVVIDASESVPVEIDRYSVLQLADSISGYDTGRIDGVPKDESFMHVSINCHQGVLFGTNGMVASGDELAASGDLRRRFARSFRHHGGEVSENY